MKEIVIFNEDDVETYEDDITRMETICCLRDKMIMETYIYGEEEYEYIILEEEDSNEFYDWGDSF